jgi:hypothetical protein
MEPGAPVKHSSIPVLGISSSGPWAEMERELPDCAGSDFKLRLMICVVHCVACMTACLPVSRHRQRD